MGIFTKIESLQDVPSFKISKEKVYDSMGCRIDGVFSIMREDTRDSLGICSDRYRPIQMGEMVDIIDTASSRIGGIVHEGYSMDLTGRKIAIKSKISSELIGSSDDPIDGYFYTIIDNTGKNSNKSIPSTMRLVCTNAFHLLGNNRRTVMMHNSNFDTNVEAFTNNIRSNIEEIYGFNYVIESLKVSGFTIDDMVKMVDDVIKPLPSKDGGYVDVTHRLTTKRDKIVDLFCNGIGNEGINKFDALNAFTQFETHNIVGKRPSINKFISSASGSGISQRAYTYLMAA